MILVLFLMIQNMQVYNDALTGLGNRRRLNQHLSNCLDRATPERPTLLFIMDINSFKSINDTFGHIEGDCALKTFARILRQVANRYYAFIARYGGDEFCFVTDVEDCDPAQVMADIQQTLADEQQKIAAGPEKYRMTVSIGYAVCDGTEQEPTAALARADQMLYKNKQLWHLKNG
jgi:diguanylate cyclase (GGDEF)-like protein